MDVHHRSLLRHSLRFITGASVVATSAALDARLVPFATVYFFLGTFAFQHDLMHAALGLPRRVRELLLLAVGASIGMSGHGTRVMHLLHHRRTDAPEDLEGATSRGSVWTALLRTPGLAIMMRPAAYGWAKPHERRWHRIEHLLNVLMLVTVLGFGGLPGLAFVMTLLAFQLTMPIWAGRIPHRAPQWLVTCASSVAKFSSVTALSLAYHELHHENPRIPTHTLSKVAKSPI